MGFADFARSASKALILALVLGVFLFSCNHEREDEEFGHRESEQAEGGQAHREEAMQRERFLAARHGFQYGIPKQAYPRAVAKMQAMERAQGPRRVGSAAVGYAPGAASPALAGIWSFIGPQPIAEKANFTGVAVGPPWR